MLKTGFNLMDFVSAILDYMKSVFEWMMNFYPFDDVPISLFYFLVGAAVLTLTFAFFPGAAFSEANLHYEDTVDMLGEHHPYGLWDDYDDDDFDY